MDTLLFVRYPWMGRRLWQRGGMGNIVRSNYGNALWSVEVQRKMRTTMRRKRSAGVRFSRNTG